MASLAGPSTAAGVRSADRPKIRPTWAPLKYGLVTPFTALTAAKLAGNSPWLRNSSTPACSPVRNVASWNAACWCAPALGSAR